ncbi:MAG: YdeI/OmpD-associated family protein [Deltaproteobacteria bacterium]|nr:YdeI/OmpD-associated family protein [Deltaproteobacteria bacterium]
MSRKQIASGVVHALPADLERVLRGDNDALNSWENLTPLARNEWICWVEGARKPETRRRRMDRLQDELKQGKKRPCCWPGCAHRDKTGRPE